MEERAEVERVTQVAEGAVGEDRVTVHAAGLNNAGTEEGGSPGAEEGSRAREGNREHQKGDGGGAEAEPAGAFEHRCEDEPRGLTRGRQPIETEAQKEDERVKSVTEAVLEARCSHQYSPTVVAEP